MHLSLASQALLLIPFSLLISPMVLGFFSAPYLLTTASREGTLSPFCAEKTGVLHVLLRKKRV